MAVPHPYSPADDGFHFDQMSDRWWETETCWFSFHAADRNLGGWLYTMVRPNIGTVAGGAWVWDDTAHTPWEVLYSENYSCLRLPRDQDLTDIQLPTGVSIRAREPLSSYDLGYDDPGRLVVRLQYDAIMPPQPLTTSGSAFEHLSHFDQFGRVHGHIELYGEHIAIDCLSMRDRSWGPRPEHRPRRASYVTGIASPKEGFFVTTNPSGDHDHVAHGFLLRDGEVRGIETGQRVTERDPVHGWVSRMRVEGVDATGDPFSAVGTTVSRIVLNRHSFIDCNSLVRWELDSGHVAWGEDQDIWPVHDWAEARRGLRPVTDRATAPHASR